MARGPIVPKNYTGRAAKLDEKIKELEAQIKSMKAERDKLYKDQLKAEKKANRIKQSDAEKDLIKAIRSSGMSAEDVLSMLTSNNESEEDHTEECDHVDKNTESNIESDIIE